MYKPAIGETCCAPYTIRLRCREFVRSKSQRKVVKRFERVLEEADEDGVGCQRWKAFTCTTSRSSFVEEEFELWKKYQVAVHGDSEDELRRMYMPVVLVLVLEAGCPLLWISLLVLEISSA